METMMQYATFKDVLVMPYFRTRFPNHFIAGIATPERLPDFARFHRYGEICDTSIKKMPKSVTTLDGNFIWGGPLMLHFGHMLAESFHRCWVNMLPDYSTLEILFICRKDYLHPAPHELPVFFYQMLDYFQVKKWRIITEPTRVENLIIGEQAKQIGQPAHPKYSEILAKHFKRINQASKTYPKKLCLTKGHMSCSRIAGEADLSRFLVKHGYVDFKPEDHDFQDQLLHVAHAERIIFTEGSTCHLFDALPPIKAHVAVINRRRGNILAKTSVDPKCTSLSVYRDVSLIMAPFLRGDSWVPSKGISYLSTEKLVKFLHSNEFIDTDEPFMVHYYEDLLEYLRYIDKLYDYADNAANEVIERLYCVISDNFTLIQNNLILRAELMLMNNRPTKAKALLEKCLQLNPNNIKARNLLKVEKS